MRIITAAVILATAASASTAAFAQARLTDTQFIKAARCAGLAGEDASRFEALVKANKRGRAEYIADKAMAAKNDAQREARQAGEGGKAQIQAELSGICANLGA